MVRKSESLAKEVSKGFDHDKGTELNEELEGTPNDMREVTYHETGVIVEETEIQGDIVPDKKG